MNLEIAKLNDFYKNEFNKKFYNLIEKYPDKPWEWIYISKNPNITWDVIENNPDKPWDW